MLKIEDGSTAYLAGHWGELADLVARDGEFDFTSLSGKELRHLYVAGAWWRRGVASPGVNRLRDQIQNREVCCVSLETPRELSWKGKYSADCGWGMWSSSSLADVLTHNLNPLIRPDLIVGRLSKRDMRLARVEMRRDMLAFQEYAREHCSWIFRSTRRGFSADGYLLRISGNASIIVQCLETVGIKLTERPLPPGVRVGNLMALKCYEDTRRGFGFGCLSVVVQSSGPGVSIRRDWGAGHKNSDAVAVVVATDQNEWDRPSPMLSRLRRHLVTTDAY